MPLIHIDGLPGTGKTTVLHALEARGYAGIDVDAGLCVWVNKANGEVRAPEAFPGGRGADGFDWCVSRVALEAVRDAAGDMVVFVAGSIGNRSAVMDLFARRIVLLTDVTVLNDRLDARPEDAWGHDPQHRAWLPDWHERVVAEADAEDAMVIRTDRCDVDAVVEKVVHHCRPDHVDARCVESLQDAAVEAARQEWRSSRGTRLSER